LASGVKVSRRLIIRATFALLLIATATVVATALWKSRRAPVRIVRARRLADSGRVTLEIRNDAPDRVRLYAVDLLARLGTNWVFVGNVPLGFTNCTERSISIDVNFPERPRPWKARLTYMPAFSREKLLRWRLAEAWKTKSLSQGFALTGWEGAQHAYSPEISE
jgi:hypothetical protein